MPGTYSQLLYHIIFSTKNREPSIAAHVGDALYRYMGGVIRKRGGAPLAINGVEDHVHLYVRVRPDVAVSDLVRDVKANSSRWVHQTHPELASFAWQEGYAAFTVSASREEAVVAYIARQREHHAQEDFRTELLRILRAHRVDLDQAAASA